MSDRSITFKNRRLGCALAGVVIGMIGFAYASVPLYDLFCRVTGYGGTTQRADAAPGQTSSRMMSIRFNADVNQELPWSFRPVVNLTTVRIGEEHLAFFQATNNSDVPVAGTAVFNVTPQKVGAYFNKIQCFCFDKQVLQPGETADFPISFFVDPDIEIEKNLDDVKTITLSYTFFPSPDDAASTATLRN